MNYKKLAIFLVSIIFTQIGLAQNIKELDLFRHFTIINDNGEKEEFYADQLKFKPNNDKSFTWYKSNQLFETMGGYDGKLLNGIYRKFYANKNLKKRGLYVKGLKQDIWQEWYENGILKKESLWQANIEDGPFITYLPTGEWESRGYLSEGLKHGKIENYSNGNISITYFNKGKIITKEDYDNNNFFRRSKKLIGKQIHAWFRKKEK